jgi:ribonuclease HII
VELEGLDDSKKLSRKKREGLFERLTDGGMGRWAVGEASLEEIEEHNILVASQIAMARALKGLGDVAMVSITSVILYGAGICRYFKRAGWPSG